MKKRIVALAAAMCLAATMAGCGDSKGEATKVENTKVENSNSVSNDKITITQYKGLEVAKVEVAEITDELIEISILSTLETMATEIEITDRAVQNGDIVLIDYVGKWDGVAFDGGTAENFELGIGSGRFIDGFEEGIIGHEIGEEFDLNLTFPDPYPHNTELSGEEVVFTVTLKGITALDYPELTDELVKEISDTSTTVEEFREEVRVSLEESHAVTAKRTLQEEVWEALMANITLESYPEDYKQELIDNIHAQYGYLASVYGVEVDELLKENYGLTSEEMAESTIKQEYAVELISELENITVSDEEYAEGLAYYAEQYDYTDTAEFEAAVGEDNLKNVILQEKVTNWLVDNCVQVEAE